MIMAASPLYPEIEPFDSGFLDVSERHTLYYEQCGNPDGKPVVYLHGGPGGCIGERSRRFFDPDAYRIILFDQRGCGRSTPFADLVDNTTWDLVADMERLREHLHVDRWQVFGGSWGSTLALAYAETHPGQVSELVVRGIFLFRKLEQDWFYRQGANMLQPDAWEALIAPIPEAERGDLVKAYHQRLTSDDRATRIAAAHAWSAWEGATYALYPEDPADAEPMDDDLAVSLARIECHYFAHDGFFESDGQLLRDAGRIADIPTTIIQGRQDLICPLRNAWDLHKALPASRLVIVPQAGHSSHDPGMEQALVEATDAWR